MGWPDRMLRETVVVAKKDHSCWLCADPIRKGETAVDIAAIDQEGGFTHGYRHNYDCYTGRWWR
jgi:hypothetical protein